jgi:hypothetical protein
LRRRTASGTDGRVSRGSVGVDDRRREVAFVAREPDLLLYTVDADRVSVAYLPPPTCTAVVSAALPRTRLRWSPPDAGFVRRWASADGRIAGGAFRVPDLARARGEF